MNYTKTYHLPQWDETDRIMRTDFNQMCADMESGLLKTARDAAAATSSAASTAAAAAKKAQDTADTALEKAAAAFSTDNPPYVMGQYTGTGQQQTIELGFSPRFLMIWGTDNNPQSTPVAVMVVTDGDPYGYPVYTTKTGFTLNLHRGADNAVNMSGKSFWYIAFR